ncbi:MAG: protein translocase subunit SecD, partial [Rhodothermia bacterium]
MLQGNGLRLLTVAFFVLMSAYYLYPTFRNYSIQKEIASLEGEERTQYEIDNYEKIQAAGEKALKLGLDLQGGMMVVLEVRVDQLVRELAVEQDETFLSVMKEATELVDESTISFVDAFAQVFNERDPEARLSRYFRNSDRGITRRSSNAEVTAYLKEEAGAAVDRAIEIIRDRVDRFGVTEPSIQKQG